MKMNIVKTRCISAKGDKNLLVCFTGWLLGSSVSKESWAGSRWLCETQRSCGQESLGTGSGCVSVSPVAASVGLVSSGECWLLASYVWLGVLTYLFDSPLWKCFLHCGEHLPCPLSQWCVPCGFHTRWHVSLSPKLEYLEIMQMMLLPRIWGCTCHSKSVHLSLQQAASILTG